MAEHRLSTPILEKQIRKIRVGDIIYLSGIVFTARDEAHHRALKLAKEGGQLPIDVEGLAMYHCGPIAQKIDGEWKILSAGPTTSSRMELFEDDFLKHFAVRVIIGKGGMGSKTTAAMKKFGAVYGAFTGGAGAFAANSIIEVKGVEWLDLGMPEAIWVFRVEDFGPMIVAIDSYGKNLYQDLMERVKRKVIRIKRNL
jgi:fumarate hydratase subunit beta